MNHKTDFICKFSGKKDNNKQLNSFAIKDVFKTIGYSVSEHIDCGFCSYR